MQIIQISHPIEACKQKVEKVLHGRTCALAIGNFDGVHIAHQEIIRLAKQKASENNSICAALTFEPHPKLLFNKEPHYLLTELSTKLDLLEYHGVELAVVIQFSHEFSRITAEDFIKQVLVETLATKSVVTGYDFCFGSKRTGNAALLADISAKLGFTYNQVRQISYDDMEVSSSHIKKLLNSGLIALASDLLGRQYSITGTLQVDIKHPSMVSMPLNSALHYPASGLYLCRMQHQSHWHYMLGEISMPATNISLIALDATEPSWMEIIANVGNNDMQTCSVEVLQILRPARQMADQAMAQLQYTIDLRDAHYVRRMCYSNDK